MAKDNQAPFIRFGGMHTLRGRNQVEKPRDGKQATQKLLLYFVHEAPAVGLLLLIIVISVLCAVYAPRFQSRAVDLIAAQSLEGAGGILIRMSGLYLCAGLCACIQNLISAHLSQRIVCRLREELFNKIMGLPVRYFDNHPHGDIMSRMTNDIENISGVISQSVGSLFHGILLITGTAVMMFVLCWQLALLSGSAMILTIVLTRYLSGKMRRFYRKRQRILGEMNGFVKEVISGYKTVSAYNHQPMAVRTFEEKSDELTGVGIRAELLGGVLGPAMSVIQNMGYFLIAVIGGYFAMQGTITVGVISAFLVYEKQFSRPINEVAQLYGQMQTALAGAERVFALMEEPVQEQAGMCTMADHGGGITFSHVNFSYMPGKPVLQDFSLHIPAGRKVALVGATGSGKTTAMNLLMRFYEWESGTICIDGIDIRDISCDKLRKNIAVVLQDTVLFTDTVEENLKYARPDASRQEVEHAARQSFCDDMIHSCPDGYGTQLSDGGKNLSQGQRQLLAIGRAFLANPKILILDEATSNIDTRTEKQIQNSMVTLMHNRTSLMIAHRLSTIRDADMIAVVDHGHIVETGTHECLMKKHGRYYELYRRQFLWERI